MHTIMNKRGIKINSAYDPIIYCGILREFYPEWTCENVSKVRDHRNKGRLKSKSLEKRVLNMQDTYRSLSNKQKAELFPFTFNLKIKSQTFEYSSGPDIFLNMTTNSIYFSSLDHYFPQGVSKSENIFEIIHMMGFAQKCEGNPGKMTFDELSKIEQMFEVPFQVWSKVPKKTGKSISRYDFKILRFGRSTCEFDEEMVFHCDEKTQTLYLVTDVKCYFKHLIRCKNYASGCYMTFSDNVRKLAHEKNCTTETKIQIIQKELSLNSVLLDKAKQFNVLPQSSKINDNFIFWDIESVLPVSQEIFGKSRVHHMHKLVSISANAHINGEHTTKVWTVDDSSEESEIKLVENFLEFCQTQNEKMVLDKSLKLCYDKLCIMSKDLRNGKKNENFDLDEISKLKSHVESQMELSLFGYNSSRYDLTIIFAHLCKVLDKQKFDRKNVSLLKKGLAYFSIKIGSLHFKDLMNFSSPMPLDRYLKIWTNSSYKLIYPYELFKSIEEIRNCKTFPPIEKFKTSLKPQVDVTLYTECKKLFDEKMSLPDSDPEKWSSFEDYLKFYNISDVYPASLALLKQFSTYLNNFGSYPMPCLGLPSYAKKCMFDLYNPDSSSIFTFPDKENTNLFRFGIIGGLTAVYKRHVTLCDEDVPDPAKFSKSGILFNFSKSKF